MADTECSICCDKYTAVVRKAVKCPFCDYKACVPCQKKYLTDGALDAHCMSCRRAWNDEFIDLNFTKAFRTGPYKAYREKVLFEREMAILPTRQPRVEAKVKYDSENAKLAQIHRELRELDLIRNQVLERANRHTAACAVYRAQSQGTVPPAWAVAAAGGEAGASAKREKTAFIMKCPDAECRGFLSTVYKCGTCQKWSCPDCLEVKGEDKDIEHTCSEEKKASVALIIKESRGCPKCGTRIIKSEGCDQMFCIDCHTAFSWTTGQVTNGVIHNPHYYEYLRKIGNGVAPRNPGDIPCGGVPAGYVFIRAVQAYFSRIHPILTRPLQDIMISIHRITAEITDYRIQNYPGNFNQNDNGDLGVLYLLKHISPEQMKKELGKREMKRNKSIAIRAILEMFVNTSTMMLNSFVNSPPEATMEAAERLINEFIQLKIYANESLIKVSAMKNCSVPQIGSNTDNTVWAWIAYARAAPVPKAQKAKKGKAADAETATTVTSDDYGNTDEEVEEGQVMGSNAAAAGGGGGSGAHSG